MDYEDHLFTKHDQSGCFVNFMLMKQMCSVSNLQPSNQFLTKLQGACYIIMTNHTTKPNSVSMYNDL